MLAVAGGTGGVGKTTVVLALGRVLADAGTRPLLVDCDRDVPDLTRRAGLLGDPTDRMPERLPGIGALGTGTSLDAVCREPDDHPGVSILPAGRGPDVTDITRGLSSLEWDGPVILDCPPGVGRDAVRPLRFADRSLLVSTALESSLVNTHKTATVAQSVDAPPAGLVLTRCSSPPGGTTGWFDCPTVCIARSSPSPIDDYISLFESEEIMSGSGR